MSIFVQLLTSRSGLSVLLLNARSQFHLFLLLGNVNAGEREFLISPEYGHSVMNAMGCHVSESRSQVKKAFDWMSEEQFHNLQV